MGGEHTHRSRPDHAPLPGSLPGPWQIGKTQQRPAIFSKPREQVRPRSISQRDGSPGGRVFFRSQP